MSFMDTASQWFTNRLAEPESRAAIGAVATAVPAWLHGSIDTSTFEIALFGAGVMFAVPGPVRQAVVDALKPAVKPMLMLACALGLAASLNACAPVLAGAVATAPMWEPAVEAVLQGAVMAATVPPKPTSGE